MDELTRETFDGVVIDYYAMGWILEDLLAHPSFAKCRSRPLLIYTAHHYEQIVRPFVARSFQGNPLLKAVLPFDASKAVRLERRILASADLVTSITDEDRDAFLKDVPDKPVLTLSPGYSGPLQAHRKIDAERPRRVLLVGAFDWIAKRQNLREFVTACCDPFASAKIELQIVGRADADFIAEIKGIYRACEFVGPVPDVYPYIGNARIGLMPDIIGGGFKLKYLDYIFGGLPVATIRSQALGLPLHINNDIIAAENHADLVSRIVSNIDDHERLDGMRQRAFAACKDAFHWSDRGRQLYDAIDKIAKKKATA
ncbi:glycosyltransferase family 4 protein [Xanthobacter flavus]|uniref:glycosyltransferase family 4 protein n=1 Tax=Xanthobacter flavus TaxID=281 RepID=UPI00372A83D3